MQAPMYLGLTIATFFYLYQFLHELYVMYEGMFLGRPDEEGVITKFTEGETMLSVLALVDVSMVMNLIVMVIIGGYSIFTSHIDLDENEDKPLWLDGLDAGMLKIKLATSLASISGVHLLKTFIDIRGSIQGDSIDGILIEIAIHMAFIISAWLLSQTEKTIHSYHHYPSEDPPPVQEDEDLEGL